MRRNFSLTYRKALFRFLSVFLLFGLWDIVSYTLVLPFAVPSVKDTLRVLFSLLKTKDYWTTIFLSVLRITEGLLIGTVIGTFLAFLCYLQKSIEDFLKPVMTVIRATPVVSFILILWIVLRTKNLVPTVISAFMVIPVVFGQIQTGLSVMDKKRMEVLEIFEIRGKRKWKEFILPSVLPYFFSAMLTCAGLSWKAGVAAEVIVYSEHSIGQKISDAKNFLDGPELFAWTLTVILFSVVFEQIILRLKKEVVKHEY